MVGTLEWDRLELTAEAAEPIVAIEVEEGSDVQAGALILQLDPQRQQARLDQAAAAARQARAKLAELERGPRREKLAQARAKLRGAAQQLAFLDSELVRLKRLLSQELVAPEEVDRAEAQRDAAMAERDGAAAQLQELENGFTNEELEQARAALAQAEAQAREARLTLQRLTVRAPVAGRLDSLPFELGEQPQPGSVVAVLLVGTVPYARIYVPEPLKARMQPGREVTVHIDGVDGALTGTITRISHDPSFTPYYALTEYDRGRVSYVAEIELPSDKAATLPAGIPLQVEAPPAP